MDAVSLGPLVLAADRFAAVLGVGAFLAAASAVAPRTDGRIGAWSIWAVLAGIAAARLGHVLENAENFAAEPWRSFAVWQGGFSWPWAVVPVLGSIVLLLRTNARGGWAVLPLAAGLVVWNVAYQATAGVNPVPLPEAVFGRLAGGDARIATDGRPMVVNLWATWCPPCRREMPLLAEVAAGRPDVGFVFANQGESVDVVSPYAASVPLRERDVLLDPLMTLSRHYAALGLPSTLFIGRDGRLNEIHTGEISREALAAALDRLAD